MKIVAVGGKKERIFGRFSGGLSGGGGGLSGGGLSGGGLSSGTPLSPEGVPEGSIGKWVQGSGFGFNSGFWGRKQKQNRMKRDKKKVKQKKSK